MCTSTRNEDPPPNPNIQHLKQTDTKQNKQPKDKGQRTLHSPGQPDSKREVLQSPQDVVDGGRDVVSDEVKEQRLPVLDLDGTCNHHLSLSLSSSLSSSSGAGIIEADDRQETTVRTVQPSFHHRHSTNRVSCAVTPHLVVRRRW